LWVLGILTFLLAIYTFYQAFRRHFGNLFKMAGILVVLAILGRLLVPWAVQSLRVKPNEFKMERPYLENNIRMTREAYGLDKFHETGYEASDTISYSDVEKNEQTIANIRLWDSRPILETY